MAADDPDYFGKQRFPDGGPFGWLIDSLHVSAPAFGKNLKVYDIDGPRYRMDWREPFARVAPGTNATFSAITINAASNAGIANLTMTLEGVGVPGGSIVRAFSKYLLPGEVWTTGITLPIPTNEGNEIQVRATAWNPGPAGQRLPDPTPDNEAKRTYSISVVKDARLDVVPSKTIIDYGEPSPVQVLLMNTGNEVLKGDLHVVERLPDEAQPNASTGVVIAQLDAEVVLEPGGVQARTIAGTSAARGNHTIRARFAMEGGGVVLRDASYFVHASPPPIFLNRGTVAELGWEAQLADKPIPMDDEGMWVALGSSDTENTVTLRALPTPAAAAVGNAKFTDLRLSIRHQSRGMPVDIVIAYARPVALEPTSKERIEVWKVHLPQGNTRMAIETNSSWVTQVIPVEPDPRDGYLDIWAVDGLELDVMVLPSGGQFFLDSLILTGIPLNGEESQRIDLIRITGEELYLPGSPTAVVGPAVPSQCPWDPPQPDSNNPILRNCWRPWSKSRALDERGAGIWRNGSDVATGMLVDGNPALWKYDDPAGMGPSERLVSPIIHVGTTEDPVLTFAHNYLFPAYPLDGPSSPSYEILKMGFVELQYAREDGNWSRFYRLVPDTTYWNLPGCGSRAEGYSGPLERDDTCRERSPGLSSWTHGDGFYHPGPCPETSSGTVCADGGYVKNMAYRDEIPSLTWRRYDPWPATSVPAFVLTPERQAIDGINLSGRDIRLAFHVSPTTRPGIGNPMSSLWTLGDVRVAPVKVFGVDAEVSGVSLDTPYDWRTLGVGPATTVPLNVTVRNVGRFQEDFQVRLVVQELNGAVIQEVVERAGLLSAGEVKSFFVPWEVPPIEGRRYEITARVEPASGHVDDENFFNDELTLGSDGSLSAVSVRAANVTAAASPQSARAGIARYVDSMLFNSGNVPLENAVVRRIIERLDAGNRSLVEERSWTLARALDVDPRGSPFAGMETNPEKKPMDDYFVPASAGLYVLTLAMEFMNHATNQTIETVAHRSFFLAEESLAYDDFEAASRWKSSPEDLWGPGPGFLSNQGVLFYNRTTGAIAPYTDAWVESPTVPLSSAQSATVNMVARYALESGYDGALLEVSVDNGSSWLPVPPLDTRGRVIQYPTGIVNSNPLAASTSPAHPTFGLSGDSREETGSLDGWVSKSFSLGALPQLTQAAEFTVLQAPSVLGFMKSVGMGVYAAEEGADDPSRWEFQNLTEGVKAQNGTFWWSGMANAGSTGLTRKLTRDFVPFSQVGVTENDAIELSWIDWRPGNAGSSWIGIGATYGLQVTQWPEEAPAPIVYATARDVRLIESLGPWNRVGAVLRGLSLNEPTTISFEYDSKEVTVGAMGWGIEDIDLRATRFVNGTLDLVARLTGDDDGDSEAWRIEGGEWQRVSSIPARPGDWSVVRSIGPDGTSSPMWHVQSRPNMDTRLITPAVDLANLGGVKASLLLKHLHNFSFEDDPSSALDYGSLRWEGRVYEGGAVEVSRFNRTTGQWDAWKQLFADAGGPDHERTERVNVDADHEGSPYDKTFADCGDSFDHFPRYYYQRYRSKSDLSDAAAFYRPYEITVSYAFTGESGPDFRTSEFDLSDYLGETVRFGFHAFATSNENGFGGMNHGWTLGSIAVVGNVLSTNDARFRVRVGTDASVLHGSLGFDQFEVSGRSYNRSIGIYLDDGSQPSTVGEGALSILRGFVKNFGSSTRRDVAVGLRTIGAAFPSVSVPDGRPEGIAPGYDRVVVIDKLEPAGEEGSVQPFAFLVKAGQVESQHRIVLEVLDADYRPSGATYAPVIDDVPGRARISWTMEVNDTAALGFERVALNPVYLESPGNVTVVATIQNLGNISLNGLRLTGRWTHVDNGDALEGKTLETGPIPLNPGERAALTLQPVALPWVGNYTLGITVTATTSKSSYITLSENLSYRVATSDIALTSGFDGTLDRWIPSGSEPWQFRTAIEGAPFGNGSVIFGYDDAAFYGNGSSLGRVNGSLVSSPIDLRVPGPDPELTFWHKPLFDSSGEIRVFCNDTRLQPEKGDAQMAGRSTEWEQVRMPLPEDTTLGCLGSKNAVIQFEVTNATGQGWRLDGVAVEGGALRLVPHDQEWGLEDSAQKAYRFLVTNSGLAPRSVESRVSTHVPSATPGQIGWFSIDPAHTTLDPGESSVFTLIAQAPPARGASDQGVVAGISVGDANTEYVATTASARFAFHPKPRADLVAAVVVDGKAARSEESDLEEAIPHEFSVILTNQGRERSRATLVRLSILEPSGSAIWEHDEIVDSLEPFPSSEQSTVVSAAWAPPLGKRSIFFFRAIVDPDRLNIDYDRTNDDFTVRVRVVPLIRPDLVVDSKDIEITNPDGVPIHEAVPGQLIRISASVANRGFSDAHDVVVRILAGGSVLKEEAVPLLRPGDAYPIRVNHFASESSPRYRVLVFTKDLEIQTANNEHTLDLPVLPPELMINVSGGRILANPGETKVVALELINSGPYPLVVTLNALSPQGPFAVIDPKDVAIGSGERRSLELTLAPTQRDLAGTRLITIGALGSDGKETRRTILVDVAETPSAELFPCMGTGQPASLPFAFDVANTGNIPISPSVSINKDGVALGRTTLPVIPPGGIHQGGLNIRLAPSTAPGLLEVSLVATLGGRILSEANCTMQVEAWGDINVAVESTKTYGSDLVAVLTVGYQGNVPTVVQPIVVGLPDQAIATFDSPSIVLMDGDHRDLRLTIAAAPEGPNGLFSMRAALVNAGILAANAKIASSVPLSIDLRRPLLEIARVHKPTHTSQWAEGQLVTYIVTISNPSALASKEVPVEFYVDGVLSARELIGEMQSGKTQDVRLNWKSTAGRHNVVIAVDPNGPAGRGSIAYVDALVVESDYVNGAKRAVPEASLPMLLPIVFFAALRLDRRTRGNKP
ncbi:MAG: hypothetical protein HY556_10550 [Euryarchaeota archaeon]|nr:hypothetical protein [Euryarchaeota archaeon]